MDIYLLLLWANYVAGKATPPEMPQLYATLALEGAEVAGVTRVAVYYANPVQVSDTEVRIDAQSGVAFDNTPDGDADEVWIYDETSGGNRWWKIRLDTPVTLVDGGNKTFAAGDLSHTIRAV
ncbi:MAG TPA: hypothetical protein VGF17_16265 [Phytomonospora sp.]